MPRVRAPLSPPSRARERPAPARSINTPSPSTRTATTAVPIQGSGYLVTQNTDWKADSVNFTSGGASAANTGGATPNTGSASSYPPYLTLNFIIKVK